jgi:hypothetical protein
MIGSVIYIYIYTWGWDFRRRGLLSWQNAGIWVLPSLARLAIICPAVKRAIDWWMERWRRFERERERERGLSFTFIDSLRHRIIQLESVISKRVEPEKMKDICSYFNFVFSSLTFNIFACLALKHVDCVTYMINQEKGERKRKKNEDRIFGWSNVC